MTRDDESFMREALTVADVAAAAGEVPVGALVVRDDSVIGVGRNCQIASNDPSAHAEVVALRAAAANTGNYRLTGCTLYSTIEPCTMCLGALVHARIARVVYGAPEPRAGAIELINARYFNHRPQVDSGCLAAECGERLTRFFRARRVAPAAVDGITHPQETGNT